jgi:formate hydrogenlyase subunit 4
MDYASIAHYGLGLLLAPLLPGVVNRVKALFGGRTGKPLLQLYYDLGKLLRKSAVYSDTTTWVFRAGPIVTLASVLVALAFVPFAGRAGLVGFSGDFFLVAYILAMGRFATILAALDTGSAFEGMGASREATYSALAEPVFLLLLIGLATLTEGSSLADAFNAASGWSTHWPALALVMLALYVILLVENCRIPFDDPTTHLELTMIHEVMALDHGGPDLGFIEYASALKLWIYCALISSLLLPLRTGSFFLDGAMGLAALLLAGVVLGVVESSIARLRLLRVPQLIGFAGACAAFALILLRR